MRLRSAFRATVFGVAVICTAWPGGPVLAQSSMQVELGALQITVVGSGQQDVGREGEGYRVGLNGIIAHIAPTQVRIDTDTFDISGASRVTVDGTNDAFKITADGQEIFALDAVAALTLRSDRGDALAMGVLAGRYFAGDGVPADANRGADLLRRSADAGLTAAQSALAHRLYAGDQMPQDAAAARNWAERATADGFSAAQGLLGYMLLKGEGGPADPPRGLSLMEQAIEDGHVNSMIRLGFAYATGTGVEQDYYQAIGYNRRAAMAGDITGTRNMAILGADSDFSVLSYEAVTALLSELETAGHPDTDAIRQLVADKHAALTAPPPQPAPEPEPAPLAAPTPAPQNATSNTPDDAAVAPPDLPNTPQPPPLPETPRYWYAADGKPAGPVTRSDFLGLRDAGVIGPETLVWETGLPNWLAAQDLPTYSE